MSADPAPESLDLPRDHPMHLVRRLYACLEEDDDVNIDGYCELWQELCGFIKKWGILLKFVTDDVAVKLDGIKTIRSENEEDTATMKGMMAWEAAEQRMRVFKPKSGTVNVLILYRAMEFVIGLIDDVYNEKKDEAKVSTIARAAYDRTLAQYHPWLVKKVVSAALLTLPYKKDFIASMRGPMEPDEDHNFHTEFTTQARDVQKRIGAFLEAYQMTDSTKYNE